MKDNPIRDPIEELRRELRTWRWLRWVLLVACIVVIALGEFYNLRITRDIGQIADVARQSPATAFVLEDIRASAYARHSSNIALALLALVLTGLAWRRNAAKALLEQSDRIAKDQPPN